MTRAWIFGAALAVLAGNGQAIAAPGPVATLPVGRVEGVRLGETDVFRGIPFAQAPVGDLRWKPPVPATDWRDVRKATEFADAGDPLKQAGPAQDRDHRRAAGRRQQL